MNFYEKLDIMCYDKSHGRLKYRGNGDYICPVCGSLWHDEKYDNENRDEYYCVRDAAIIWDSLGKDENFMFGYSEEDLLLALESLNFRNKKGIPGV